MIERLPRFSIVIPTYRRPERLFECLDSLSRLDYPRDCLEVIVVDDGGDRPLDDIVNGFAGQIEVRLLWQPNAGPGAARNRGAAKAKGAYLAFTDDDCRPEPTWLRAYAEAIARHPDALLGGDTLNGIPRNLWSAGSQAVQSWLYDYFETHDAAWRFFASNNICLASEAFAERGGFDTETIHFASEDREFCERWVHRGGRLQYVPAARISHFHHLTARSFLAQHFAYGRGAFRLRLARQLKGMPSPPRDRRWIREYLTGYPWRAPGLDNRLRLATTALLSFATTAAGYYFEGLVAHRAKAN